MIKKAFIIRSDLKNRNETTKDIISAIMEIYKRM